MSDKCQRCGEDGQDRRTLWMACFYDMAELNLPFDEVQIHGELLQKAGEKKVQLFGEGPYHRVTEFEKPSGKKEEIFSRAFYTLRVCKDCRADWMNAIAEWFKNPPEKESCGSGIFVRRNGAMVEISREEWDQENPGREPVVLRP